MSETKASNTIEAIYKLVLPKIRIIMLIFRILKLFNKNITLVNVKRTLHVLSLQAIIFYISSNLLDSLKPHTHTLALIGAQKITLFIPPICDFT